MKKSYLFAMLLLFPFLFLGCEFMCTKNIFTTYLVLNNLEDSDVKVYCKSEKLEISDFTECMHVIDKQKLQYLEKNNIINRNICSVFYVPADNRIDDHTNITLSFVVDIDGKIYNGEVYLNKLKTNDNKLEQIPFELFSENGSRLSAIFTYELQLIL